MDINISHEFQPNRKGLCTQMIGGKKRGYSICHLTEEATAHKKWLLAHLKEKIEADESEKRRKMVRALLNREHRR